MRFLAALRRPTADGMVHCDEWHLGRLNADRPRVACIKAGPSYAGFYGVSLALPAAFVLAAVIPAAATARGGGGLLANGEVPSYQTYTPNREQPAIGSGQVKLEASNANAI